MRLSRFVISLFLSAALLLLGASAAFAYFVGPGSG